MAATQGNNAQFTYDFGIAIAQSTINKVSRLTGVSLSLAGAFYALRNTSEQYVNTLRKNVLFSGGVLDTMKAMEQAQNRLIKGLSSFNVDDQLEGMRRLQSVGIGVGKNLDWISKAAHATGKSFAEFSGAISSAIQGNMSGLVDMGLMTQRATRMFEKYGANTIMRQQAILNFVKSHKGLQSAIMNDFTTIQDQIKRIQEAWRGFLQSVIGKPNDPSSFYGQIVQALKMVADALGRNFENIKKVGSGIGTVLGWFVKQVGSFVTWVGKLVKRAMTSIWGSADAFVEWCRSLVVWLEFWKLKIIDFFKEYKDQIKWAAIAILSFKALKTAFVIGSEAILSLVNYRRELMKLLKFMDAARLTKGEGIGKLFAFNFLKKSRNRQLLRAVGIDPRKVPGVFMDLGRQAGSALAKGFAGVKSMIVGALGFLFQPWKLVKNSKALFGPLIALVKGLGGKIGLLFKSLGKGLLNLPKLVGVAFKSIKTMFMALNTTNPVGWIILAVTLIVTLYKKCEGFRKLINGMMQILGNWAKLLGNTVMAAYAGLRYGIQQVWGYVSGFFKWIGESIKNVWGNVMNSKFGQWINDVIVKPLAGVFEWVTNLWSDLWKGLLKGVEWICNKLGMATDWMGNAAQQFAAKGGFQVKTFDSNQYTENGTDYLDPDKWGFNFGGGDEAPTGGNPVEAGLTPAMAGGGEDNSTHMTFNSGAIQIIVEKGTEIDEDKLARKVREVITETSRETQIRGGY